MSTALPAHTNGETAVKDMEGGAGVFEKPAPEESTRSSPFSRAYLFGPVKRDHADLALLACCFTTGMVDSASFANWSVFVGMQTALREFGYLIGAMAGNTVILGLSTARLPQSDYAWLATLVSIVSFLIGCYATFHITSFFAPADPYSKRLVIVSLFLVQSLLIILSAALATATGLIPQNPPSAGVHTAPTDRITSQIGIVSLIPPLAFQSGMQIACSRLLGLNELPVNVLTSTYCDMMGDFKLFALNNVKRNRRLAAVIFLLVGAICSGWLMRSSGGLMSVLWIAAGIKFLIAWAILCFMPAAQLLRTLSNNQ